MFFLFSAVPALSLINEGVPAFRAVDLQRTLALWHPNHLTAISAAVKIILRVIIFSPSSALFTPAEGTYIGLLSALSCEAVLDGQIFLIFPLPFKNVPRHNPKVRIYEQQQACQI